MPACGRRCVAFFCLFLQNILLNANFDGKMIAPVLGEHLVNTSDFRRENFRRLVDESGGPTAVAKLLGYTNASYVVQMIGPNPMRPVTERTARKVESAFGLPVLSLDRPVEVEPAPAAALAPSRGKPKCGMSASEFVEVINVVVRICEEEGASLSNRKFADIVSLVAMDADRRGGGTDEAMVRTLVHLAQ